MARVHVRRSFAPLVVSTLFVLAGPAAAQQQVLAIGDSITEGAMSGGSGTPYVDVLAAELGAGYTVSNQGCGGSSSFDWRPQTGGTVCNAFLGDLFDARVAPNLPTAFATVMLGTNDAVGFFEPAPIPVETYAAHIADLVAGIRAGGADHVVLMTPPPRCAGTDPAVIGRLEGYRNQIIAICLTTPGVVCGPDVYTLLDPVVHFASCDVHPNAAGHALLGQALADVITSLPACSNGLDDDGDGHTDFGADPGCALTNGTTESPECNDGIDNDGDGHVDLADPGCAQPFGHDESPQCSDGVHNDNDGLIDFPADPECASPADDSEGCGLGPELALLLPWLLRLRRRRLPL